MAQKYRMLGIEKLEIGEVGADGAMGSTLAELEAIVPDSVVFEIGEPEVGEILIEGQDDPDVISIIRGGIKTVTAQIRDASIEMMELFFGGTVATTIYSAPVKSTPIYQSVKITCESVDGKALEISIPKVLVTAKLDGAAKASDSGMISASLKVLAPCDASGVALSPYQWTFI